MSNPAPLRPSDSAASSDAAIVARVRAGDEAAFEELYRAHHAALWSFAFGYVRSSAVAEDLVQDVFLALWRERGGWAVRTCVRSWLYAAVRNLAFNHLRHERVVARLRDEATGEHAAPDAATIGMGAADPDAHVALEARELDDAVMRALAAIPERRRAAMLLRWKHDLAPAEIARVLGTTPEAVRVLLTRARQELAGLLKRAGR